MGGLSLNKVSQEKIKEILKTVLIYSETNKQAMEIIKKINSA